METNKKQEQYSISKKQKSTLPELIVIEQGTKLKNATGDEIQSLINYLLSVMAVSVTDRERFIKETIAVGELFKTALGNYTEMEIKKAFGLAIEGTLDVKLYQSLNCVVIGNVMKAFKKYKSNKLQQYRREQITKQVTRAEKTPDELQKIEAEFLETCLFIPYESYKKGIWTFTPGGLVAIYNLFDKRKLIHATDELKLEYKEKAIKQLQDKFSNPTNKEEKSKFKHAFKKVGQKETWITTAKELLMTDEIKSYADFDKDLREILKHSKC